MLLLHVIFSPLFYASQAEATGSDWAAVKAQMKPFTIGFLAYVLESAVPHELIWRDLRSISRAS